MFEFFRKDNEKDPDSKKLWQDFINTDQDWCCKALLKVPMHVRFVTIAVDGCAVTMPFDHCPRCGKALRKIPDKPE